MTVATMFIGLLPVMLAGGTGSVVMKRIAAPVLGGLATSFLMELVVYPVLYAIWKSRGLGRAEGAAVTRSEEYLLAEVTTESVY